MEGITDFKNIHEMLRVTVESYPEKEGYRWILNDAGETRSVTWGAFYEDAVSISKSLLSMGIKKGDKIGIIGFCSYEWVLCDIGTVFIGGVSVGIYQSLLAEGYEYIINHSGLKIIFVENKENLEKIFSIRKKIPNVQKIILLDGIYTGKNKSMVLSFEEFLKTGKKTTDHHFKLKSDQVKPKDLASIVYTSGTSGSAKGVMITQDNIIFTSQLVKYTMPIQDTDETLLFLPLAHIFARVDIYATMISNVTLTFCRSIETVVDDLKIVRPHWFPSVPRVFEKVYIKIKDGVEKKGAIAMLLFKWAMRVGYKVSDHKLAKSTVPPFLNFQYNLATKLIFSKIHQALGGRVRFCVSGAAPLNASVARFFHAAGIIILEGYGMTENTSFTNTSTMENIKFGSVGFSAKGVEQKIDDSGEILFRGRNVMKGYYKNSKETRKTLTSDGWLHTGDLGCIDSEGFLTITGRQKDLIITSGGKNISPSRIESRLLASKYISQVCVIGDRRNYCTALIALNPETITEFDWSSEIPLNDIEAMNSRDEIKELIQKEVDQANSSLASYESVKYFTLVPEFTVDDGLITPTMKPKRYVIMEVYKREIDALYE